jgi:hypothetical protein
MPLQPFTRNYEDNSTDAGFQFTFYCDKCHDGYKTQFIESKTYRKSGLIKGIARGISVGSSLLGGHHLWEIERGADILTERFDGMSPEWHKEHEAAFQIAQNEAKQHFHRCPRCREWVCEEDWNDQEGLCTDCAPRMNVEMNAIKAEKVIRDMRDKADNTTLFDGDIESKQTICPECGKPSGEGKFCTNCGASLGFIKCSKCGAKSPIGTRFCGECGTRL